MTIKNIQKYIWLICYEYIEILKFVQMAENDNYKFTWAARNQEYLLRLFQENRTETWIYNLNCKKL